MGCCPATSVAAVVRAARAGDLGVGLSASDSARVLRVAVLALRYKLATRVTHVTQVCNARAFKARTDTHGAYVVSLVPGTYAVTASLSAYVLGSRRLRFPTEREEPELRDPQSAGISR